MAMSVETDKELQRTIQKLGNLFEELTKLAIDLREHLADERKKAG